MDSESEQFVRWLQYGEMKPQLILNVFLIDMLLGE